MKLFLTILMLAGCYMAPAQNIRSKPDFKAIEKNINDKASPYYYAPLLKRYEANDTTLTQEEYRHLYYGFSFQDDYSAYGKSKLQDQVNAILKKTERDPGDLDTIISLEKRILKEFPFNIRNMYMLHNVYEVQKDSANMQVQFSKLMGVISAIMSTGDGRTDSTAMYVISVEHEYDLIGLMGYEVSGQALINAHKETMDKMSLKENDDEIKALYFNIDRLFAYMNKLFKKD